MRFVFFVDRSEIFSHELHEMHETALSRNKAVLQIRGEFVRITVAFFAGFVYRLGREILILERRVRFPYLVPNFHLTLQADEFLDSSREIL